MGFGAYIREETKNGQEIVDMALALMRNKKLGARLRLQAGEFLTDRAWGRPVQQNVLTFDYVQAFITGQRADVETALGDLLPEQRDRIAERISELWQERAQKLAQAE